MEAFLLINSFEFLHRIIIDQDKKVAYKKTGSPYLEMPAYLQRSK